MSEMKPGLLKNYEIFYFFNIEDASKFKPQLEEIANKVISPASGAQDMRTETFFFFYNSARHQGKITGPPVLQIAGVNIAVSYGGLAKDGIAPPQLEGLDDPRANTPKKSFRSMPPGVIITGRGGGHKEPDLAKDGSYMAFRKLRQFVPEFKDFLQREASRLGYTPEQLGARLVGRWESGAPVETNPDADNPADAEKDDFHFTKNDQSKCPFAAHIRKARPRRDVKSAFGNNVDEAKFDIMRRGIPTPVQPGPNPIMTDRVKNATHKDKKLFMNIVDSKQQAKKIEFDPFVESHGGAYFFMPSLDLLREMAH
ncbi:hypothetical protein SI65_02956 [Aspergillus cristatus]|uniref:DyP dimeric alpha+beta barrel domain-containing protein n=1 Tax=Aspergillus cristatus TaxID=573508 RepID=A0A1E3BMC1_ASPCR|nr:hypothetical protein SI65_02956 [Aspergillus cristatus]